MYEGKSISNQPIPFPTDRDTHDFLALFQYVLGLRAKLHPYRVIHSWDSKRNGYELIPHPTYSPNLAPSDYFLFPILKKDIRGRHFRSNEEVVAAVEEWVGDKDPGFFSSGLMALEHHWSKCIILEGNYIEKEDIDLTQK